MMEIVKAIRNHVLPYWKSILVISLPVVLSPLLVAGDGKEAKAAYAILLVAAFWMTEAMPIPAASILPIALLPVLGVMSTGKVCRAYMNETTMMFIGSVMLALTVEYCNLHKRVALKVLLNVGTSPRWLLLGFMLTTAILSMWISNAATTAMMLPIVDAIIHELYKDKDPTKCASTSINIIPVESTLSVAALVPSDSSVSLNSTVTNFQKEHDSCNAEEDRNPSQTTNHDDKEVQLNKEGAKMRKCAFLAVAYASNIGGCATLIGTGSNLILKGMFKELYEQAPSINFGAWIAFNVPGMFVNLFLAWVWLQFLFMGFKSATGETPTSESVKNVLRKKYEDLGPISFHEFATATLFSICVLLWFFRDPQFIPGWAVYLNAVKIDDATAVVTIVVLLFVVPSKLNFWCFRSSTEMGPERPTPALLDWSYAQERVPWGIVLLLGGGYALSDASKVSGLSSWIGSQLTGLLVLPPFAIMVVICIMTAIVTEVASNTATTNILLPILSEMALTMKLNPLYFMIPATVTSSFAFMLPVAAPPNAIVFAAGKMTPKEMARAGFMVNIICVTVICLSMVTLGNVMFQLDQFPEWAVPAPEKLTVNTQVFNCSSTAYKV